MLFKICLYCCTSFQTLRVQTTRSDYMQMLLILRARSRTQTPLGQDKEARKAKRWHLVCENLSEISQYTADPTHLTFDCSKKYDRWTFHQYLVIMCPWGWIKNIFIFLAVQNSSLGDLVTESLTHSLTVPFTFEIQRATQETCDLWDIWSEWCRYVTWPEKDKYNNKYKYNDKYI